VGHAAGGDRRVVQAGGAGHLGRHAEGDSSAGPGRSRFEKLRYFKNWPTAGIAYAAPDMQGGNFWGVINHDNEEGIIRIADNRVTRGLKMWTWGFPSFRACRCGRFVAAAHLKATSMAIQVPSRHAVRIVVAMLSAVCAFDVAAQAASPASDAQDGDE
jgi:hypothetical protein